MIKLFSGTAHQQLSKQVAKKLEVTLSRAEVIRFDDSEVRVTIQEDVKNETCIIIQPTSMPTDENLMELFFYCDALRRSQASKIIGVIPYFGYARQNIQHRPGESLSLHVVVKFLETVGFGKIITFDLHEEASQGIFSIPFESLNPFIALAPKVKEYFGGIIFPETVTIVSPDQEGIERARSFGEAMFGNDNFATATVNKKRDIENAHQSAALELYGDVKDKNVIIVDDIVTSGGTIVNAANLCIERGAARVIAVISHHDFGPDAAEKIQNSAIEKFFTTNSIPLEDYDMFEKLQEVSLAPLIADIIKHDTA